MIPCYGPGPLSPCTLHLPKSGKANNTPNSKENKKLPGLVFLGPPSANLTSKGSKLPGNIKKRSSILKTSQICNAFDKF